MDQSQLMAQKDALNQTCNSRGYFLIEKIMEAIAADAAQKVIDCADEAQIIALQRKAAAAKEFIQEFRKRVAELRMVDIEDPHFMPIVMD